MGAFETVRRDVPEGMVWQYQATLRNGRLEHIWAIANEAGGVHVSAWRVTESNGRTQWLGGIECHSPKKLYESSKDEPDHEHCWLLGGPCWHDGSSLQFREQVADTLPDGDEMGDDEHGFILRLMIHRHRVWLTEREDA